MYKNLPFSLLIWNPGSPVIKAGSSSDCNKKNQYLKCVGNFFPESWLNKRALSRLIIGCLVIGPTEKMYHRISQARTNSYINTVILLKWFPHMCSTLDYFNAVICNYSLESLYSKLVLKWMMKRKTKTNFVIATFSTVWFGKIIPQATATKLQILTKIEIKCWITIVICCWTKTYNWQFQKTF